MESNPLFKILIIGPTGAGKSQFCNFSRKDLTNSINKVSDSLDSCTADPFSNIFKRGQYNLEFIDSAGNSDSSNNDKINLQKLVDYLKEKKSIEHIILVLKFGERLTNNTRDYLKNLGNIFTPSEFYCHLSVVFTKYPIKPKTKDKNTLLKSIEEINKILKNIFNIKEKEQLPEIDVYSIDTEIDEDDNSYDQKSQDTIDIMIKKIDLSCEIFGSISTINFDCTGLNCEKRKEEEKKIIEIKKKELEEREKYLKELEKKNKEEHEKEMKRIEEQRRKREEELLRKEKLIEEEIIKKQIEINKLDKYIDAGLHTTKFGFKSLLLSIGAGIGAIALATTCPVAAPIIFSAAVGSGVGSSIGIVGGLGFAGVNKIRKAFS